MKQHSPTPWVAGDNITTEPIKGVISLEDDGGCSDPDCCGGASYHIAVSAADVEFIVRAVNSYACHIQLLKEANSAIMNEFGSTKKALKEAIAQADVK